VAIKSRSPRTRKVPQLLEVSDMTGGVDLRRSPTLLAPNRARSLSNYSLEEPGALVVRRGWQRASSGSLGSGRAQGGQRVYLSSRVFSVLAWNGAIYNPTDAWVFGSPVHSSLSTANQVFFPYDREIVIAMDGANRPVFSTSGASWLLLGIDKPSTGPTISSHSSGGLSSGEYAIGYSYKHRGTQYESNVSAESTITITASTGAIGVTPAASSDPKVDAYKVYARHKTPDNESVMRYVSSAAIGSSVTITSSAWTSADEAPTTHGVPVAVRFGVFWKNRCWAPDAVTKNRLRFTELFLAQAWPDQYYIDIPFEKGDDITAITPLGDTLLVKGQSGIFLVIGQTALDFEVRPSQGADNGQFGPRAGDKVEQADIHVGSDGVDSFDGGTDRSLEHDLTPAYNDLTRNTAGAALERIAAVYHHSQKELRVSVPRLYPSNAAGEWVLNLDRTRENEGTPAWSHTDRDVAFYMHWNGNEPTAGNRGRLFSMPSTSGVVFEESTGATANSSNVTAQYDGPTLSLGLHRARVTGLHLEYEPHAGNFTAEVLTDNVSNGQIAIDIGAGLFPYGAPIPYGTASRTYGAQGRFKAYTPLPMSAEGRTVSLRTTYTGQERFKWYGYAFDVLPEPMPTRMGN
jgi:hypothetical protein